MITFTLMFASLGLGYLLHRKYREPWLADYLFYTLSYAFWLFFATYIFFQTAFFPVTVSWLDYAFAYARAGISVLIALFGSRFFLGAAGFRGTKVFHPGTAGFTFIVTALIVLSLGFSITLLGRMVTILFNAVFFTLALLAMSRGKKQEGAVRLMFPFFLFSASAYALLSILGIILPRLIPAAESFRINILAVGIYCFIWSLLMLFIFMNRLTEHRRDDEIAPSFGKDYGISRREAEIIRLIAAGKTSPEISEKLFISPRTVETHCYNIYRKCGVKNRIELIGLLKRYSS
ncbi:MAG: response regulator transcription factor [Spirochaetia bacterium]